MRTLTIDLLDVGGKPREGDYVLLQAPLLRGSAENAGAVIMTAPLRVDLQAGKGQAKVEPGPLLVQIRSRSLRDAAPFEVTIPNGEGVVTLRSCMERQFRYQPLVETAVSKAADRANEAWQNAIIAEQNAVAKANEAIQKVDTAVHNGAILVREAVKEDADRAERAVATVTAKAETATQNATAAEEHKNEAVTAASNAQGSADSAKNSASIATTSASSAQNSMTAARNAVSATSASESAAHQSAEAAKQYRDQAETHTRQAETAKTDAQASATQAEEWAQKAKLGAPETGWAEDDLAQAVRNKLNRQILLADIQGIPANIQQVSSYTLPNSIVARDSTGRARVYDPINAEDAANKKYVDELRLRRQAVFISEALTRTNADVNLALTRVNGNIDYSGSKIILGAGIYRITVSTQGITETVFGGMGKIQITVESGATLVATSDYYSDSGIVGYIGTATLVVDTRNHPNATATTVINAKKTGFTLLIQVEDLMQ